MEEKVQDTVTVWVHGDLIQEELPILAAVTEDNIVIIIHKMMIDIVHGEQVEQEVIQMVVILMVVMGIMVR
tara:strand:- start:503 stop:715 length:213 start_codon:yes stop_codon:yes gene_type:complete